MAVFSDLPYAKPKAIAPTLHHIPEQSASKRAALASSPPSTATATPSKASSETAISDPNHTVDTTYIAIDNTNEFTGNVNTNNDIPSQETLKKLQNFAVLDKDGKTVPFRNLYSGPNVARRVLIIFIRHFFCGNCQEYIRALASSLTPTSLLSLPTPTFIAIVGCGSPSLIPMYTETTSCPFPVYADPTKRLYESLGMLRTLNLGTKRPEYQRKGIVKMAVMSVLQGVKHVKDGRAWKGGDMQQVGGEFLFEPVDASTPIQSPDEVLERQRGNEKGYLESGYREEEKMITWCHRMKNTRDHAETPELREVLGFDGEGVSGKNKRRWTRALGERKGTSLNGRESLSAGRTDSDVNIGKRSEQLVRD